MRLKLILGLGMLLLWLGGSALAADQSTFRDLKWGAELSGLTGMLKLEKNETVEFYRKYGESMKLGQAELKKVAYGFYKGRFCVAVLEASGSANYSAIKAELDALYGPPRQLKGEAGGPPSTRTPRGEPKRNLYESENLEIELVYIEAEKKVVATYVFKPLLKQIEQDEAAKRKPKK